MPLPKPAPDKSRSFIVEKEKSSKEALEERLFRENRYATPSGMEEDKSMISDMSHSISSPRRSIAMTAGRNSVVHVPATPNFIPVQRRPIPFVPKQNFKPRKTPYQHKFASSYDPMRLVPSIGLDKGNSMGGMGGMFDDPPSMVDDVERMMDRLQDGNQPRSRGEMEALSGDSGALTSAWVDYVIDGTQVSAADEEKDGMDDTTETAAESGGSLAERLRSDEAYVMATILRGVRDNRGTEHQLEQWESAGVANFGYGSFPSGVTPLRSEVRASQAKALLDITQPHPNTKEDARRIEQVKADLAAHRRTAATFLKRESLQRGIAPIEVVAATLEQAAFPSSTKSKRLHKGEIESESEDAGDAGRGQLLSEWASTFLDLSAEVQHSEVDTRPDPAASTPHSHRPIPNRFKIVETTRSRQPPMEMSMTAMPPLESESQLAGAEELVTEANTWSAKRLLAESDFALFTQRSMNNMHGKADRSPAGVIDQGALRQFGWGSEI
jgi:hypothetical protein